MILNFWSFFSAILFSLYLDLKHDRILLIFNLDLIIWFWSRRNNTLNCILLTGENSRVGKEMSNYEAILKRVHALIWKCICALWLIWVVKWLASIWMVWSCVQFVKLSNMDKIALMSLGLSTFNFGMTKIFQVRDQIFFEGRMWGPAHLGPFWVEVSKPCWLQFKTFRKKVKIGDKTHCLIQ